MQIKKFRANDTAEALSLIRKEFGSRAVILSSKDVAVGAGVFGFRKKHCVEVTAATDAESTQTVSEPESRPVGKLSLKTRIKDSVAPVSLKGRRRVSHLRGEKSMNGVGRIAVQELEVYSRIFDVPMEVASTRRQLEQSLYNLRRKDVILIDTPGISRNENALLRRIQDLLQSVKSAEIHLLMSATTREKDFKTILNRFKVMNINKLIFTRLDDSTEYGDLLNQLIDTRIPASYFADGPQVPENIEVATLDKLVDLLLKKAHSTKIAAPMTHAGRDNGKRLVYGPYPEKRYAYS
ncbi:MAG: hypothetical protein B6240_09145 [Desulfobacteraceae bacterium 4572_87]|nr:MAG: hypothetical protein B6240_09145 [Desulfobacteraceae bacterium 4572_87]